MAVLKGIAAHYVMQADDRVLAMARQRELLAELVDAVLRAGPSAPGATVRRRLGGGARRRGAAPGRWWTRSRPSPTPAPSPGTPGWCSRARRHLRAGRPAVRPCGAARGERSEEPPTLSFAAAVAALAALDTLSATTGACCLADVDGLLGLLLDPRVAPDLVDRAHDLVVALASGAGAEHVAHADRAPAGQLPHDVFSLSRCGGGFGRCDAGRHRLPCRARWSSRPARGWLGPGPGPSAPSSVPSRCRGCRAPAAGAPPRPPCPPGAGDRARARSRAPRRRAAPGW